MSEYTDVGTLTKELYRFQTRVRELKAVDRRRPEQILDLLDATLLELELADEELHACCEELAAHHATAATAVHEERRFLLSVFTNLPSPTILLNRDGMVRRANRAASELSGASASYLNGRPFVMFLDPPSRAVFRARLSAVRRGRDGGPFPARMAGPRGFVEVVLTLTAIPMPSDVNPVVAVVACPAGGVSARRSAEPGGENDLKPENDLRLEIGRRDLLARVMASLAQGDCVNEYVLARRVARELAAGFADWVIVDLRDGDQVRRAAVIGPAAPDAPAVPMVEGTPIAGAPVRALESGTVTVQPAAADESALGPGPGGVPLLTVLRAGSLMCAPLGLEDGRLGAVTLVRSAERDWFDLADLSVVQQLAGSVGTAVGAARDRERRATISQVLQSSLLPRSLPSVPGLRFAAIYLPAADTIDVGGDFYDVYPSGDGWGMLLGDVCGKGEEAAAITASVRHAARALALDQDRPADVLDHINRMLVAQHDADRYVTAVAAHLLPGPEGTRVRLASAGHPPAVIVHAGGTTRLTAGGGCPLGLFGDGLSEPQECTLRPGDTLVLYSDGLSDQTNEAGERFGDRTLLEALMRDAGKPPSIMVERLEAELRRFRSTSWRDDLGVLAAQVTAPR